MSMSKKRVISALIFIAFSIAVIFVFHKFIAPLLYVGSAIVYFYYPILMFAFLFLMTRKCWLEIWA